MSNDRHGGLLSQTLASSPCIKFILPARIRSALHNDVLMVGHSAIYLQEFLPISQLSNSIATWELGVQILAAKVISAQEIVVTVEDEILSEGKDEVHFKIKGEPVDEAEPPQIVVLSIATGELIYLYARQVIDGSTHFIHARRHILRPSIWPDRYGKHLAIDPE